MIVRNYITQAARRRVVTAKEKSQSFNDRLPDHDPSFWDDSFHVIAFHAYIEASHENKHMNSEYVKKLAYAKYEKLDIIA